eukprot:m.93949 g.93949  ORF g.93949 m.93949 type:complete len:136 (-) comp8920_c0_seq7:5373-5780(-)
MTKTKEKFALCTSPTISRTMLPFPWGQIAINLQNTLLCHVHFMGWCSPGCVKCTVAVDNVMENECLSNTYFTFPTHFEVCPSQSPDKIGVSGIIAAVFIGSLVGLGVMATFYLCFKNSSRKAAHYRILTPSVQSH